MHPSATQVAWPVAVAAVLTVVLTVVSRRLARPAPHPRSRAARWSGWPGWCAWRIPLLALPVIPGATVDPGHEPGLSFYMVTGWGLLAGGLLAAGLLGVGPRVGCRVAGAAGRCRAGEHVVGLPP